MYRKDAGSTELFDLPEEVEEKFLLDLVPNTYDIQWGQGYIDIFNETSSKPVVSYTHV